MDHDLHDFIDQSEYYETAGSVVPYSAFVAQFIRWLGCDHRILYWLQKARIERALIRGGFPVGRVMVLGKRPEQITDICVGNLAGPSSRIISSVPVVFDDELQMLMPRDPTKTEQLQLRL